MVKNTIHFFLFIWNKTVSLIVSRKSNFTVKKKTYINYFISFHIYEYLKQAWLITTYTYTWSSYVCRMYTVNPQRYTHYTAILPRTVLIRIYTSFLGIFLTKLFESFYMWAASNDKNTLCCYCLNIPFSL